MSRVVHFEISADEPERAMEFYRSAFGWCFHRWEGTEHYWLVMTGHSPEPGIDGGLFLRQGQIGHINTISVDSLDQAISRIESAGGRIVVDKRAIPGIGWLAYCKDTEDSVFGIIQNDPTAS